MRIYFYADEEDIQGLIKLLFCLPEITFFKSSWVEGERHQFHDAESMMEDVLANERPRMYFACAKIARLRTRVLNLNNGEVRHSINHGVMPDSVRVFFGQKADENFLVQSTVDGFCETALSMAMFKSIANLVVENSKKVGRVFVFPGAERKYGNGWVLTPNREASKELHFVM